MNICMHYKYISSSRGQNYKNQCAIARRTSQIMKYGQDVMIQNGQMYNIQNEKWN